jgi:transcriptional regulator with GAF, ATPase, and Fis domain
MESAKAEVFEAFLVELSTRFTDLPADQVETQVEQALESLVNLLGTDRSTFMELSFDPARLRPVASWGRAGLPTLSRDQPMEVELPWYFDQIRAGRAIVMFDIPESLPPEAKEERDYCIAVGMKANLTLPISVGGRFSAAIASGSFTRPIEWPHEVIQRVRIVGQILANALHRKRAEEELIRSLEEVRQLKDRLEAENIYLREEARSTAGFDEIVGRSPGLLKALALVTEVAPTDGAVLLLGETGTGKEILANAIHSLSPRKDRPLVKVNCASIPASLLESELFGHEKGAFTGAVSQHLGRFEIADGGTLFLDEIGDMPLDLQSRLLRVLEDRIVQRVGSERGRKVDFRLISATNRDLLREVAEGRFRRDLFYRLSLFPITLPPLRERKEDIPLLIWALINRRQAEFRRQVERIAKADMRRLMDYDWPGNIRELENVILRALILSPGKDLRLEGVIGGAGAETGPVHKSHRLDAVEKDHILATLQQCAWRINGPGGAAAVLGLKHSTLRSRMKKLGITRSVKLR